MGVTIKTKTLTIVKLVERLFSPEAVKGGLLTKALELEANGFTLVVHPTYFSIADKSGKSVSANALKLEAVTLVMKNKLGKTVKKAICEKIAYLIDTAYAYINFEVKKAVEAKDDFAYVTKGHPDVYAAFNQHYVLNGNKVAAIKAIRNLTGLGLKEAKDLCDEWQEQHETKLSVTAGELTNTAGMMKVKHETHKEKEAVMDKAIDAVQKNAPMPGGASLQHPTSYYNPDAEFACLMSEATMLHQPVHGTSGGSRYHVIALSETVVVAVRIQKNNSMAIRAVSTAHPSTKIAQHDKAGFVAAGLDKKGGGHYSLHLEPASLIMVKKCVGSILFAMGGNFSAMSDRVENLVGVGS